MAKQDAGGSTNTKVLFPKWLSMLVLFILYFLYPVTPEIGISFYKTIKKKTTTQQPRAAFDAGY